VCSSARAGDLILGLNEQEKMVATPVTPNTAPARAWGKPAASVTPVAPSASSGYESIRLLSAHQISKQFKAYGAQADWSVYWEAPEYSLEEDRVVLGDFETALSTFVQDANDSGVRIRVTFNSAQSFHLPRLMTSSIAASVNLWWLRCRCNMIIDGILTTLTDDNDKSLTIPKLTVYLN